MPRKRLRKPCKRERALRLLGTLDRFSLQSALLADRLDEHARRLARRDP